jgi:hypothetical protein
MSGSLGAPLIRRRPHLRCRTTPSSIDLDVALVGKGRLETSQVGPLSNLDNDLHRLIKHRGVGFGVACRSDAGRRAKRRHRNTGCVAVSRCRRVCRVCRGVPPVSRASSGWVEYAPTLVDLGSDEPSKTIASNALSDRHTETRSSASVQHAQPAGAIADFW